MSHATWEIFTHVMHATSLMTHCDTHSHIEVVQALLLAGVDPSSANENGVTPLMLSDPAVAAAISAGKVDADAFSGALSKMPLSGKNRWASRYFVLRNGALMYFKKKGDVEPKGIVELDATTKIDACLKRTYCFKVVTSSQTLVLSADVERTIDDWRSAIAREIARIAIVRC